MACLSFTEVPANIKGPIHIGLIKLGSIENPKERSNKFREMILGIKEKYDITDENSLKVLGQYIEDRKKIYPFGNTLGVDATYVLTAKGSNIENPLVEEVTVLKTAEQKRGEELTNADFLTASYGTATEVRRMALMELKKGLVRSMLINDGKPVEGEDAVNRHIREFQNELFENIVAYFNSKYSEKAGTIKQMWTKTTDGNYVYSGYFDHADIQSFAKDFLSPEKQTSKNLIERWLNKDKNADDALFLKAYNSWILLTNFDQLLRNEFGKNLGISDFGLFSDDVKYKLADNTSKNGSRWDQKELAPIEVLGSVTRMLMETFQMYNWNSGNPIADYYMKPEWFNDIIVKIKKLANEEWANNFRIDENTLSDKQVYYMGVKDVTYGEKVRQYLNDPDVKGKSLTELITLVRDNSQKYYKVLFDILSDNGIWIEFGIQMNSAFNKIDKNTIYSIYKNMYDPSNKNAVYNTLLNNPESERNYYSYFTHAADYTSPMNMYQYFIDYDGTIKMQTLRESNHKKLQKKLESQFLSAWGRDVENALLSRIKKKYPIQIIEYEENTRKFRVTIPEVDLMVEVNFHHASGIHYNNFWDCFEFFKRNGEKDADGQDKWIKFESEKAAKEYLNTPEIFDKLRGFFSTFYMEDFSKNSKLGDVILAQDPDPTFRTLAGALCIYSNSVMQKSIVDETWKYAKNLWSEISKYYPTENTYPKLIGSEGISLIPPMANKVLENLAYYMDIANGTATKSTNETAEGKNVAANALAQLAADTKVQFELQNKRPYNPDTGEGSITYDFPIIADSSVFLGNSRSSEWYDRKNDTIKQRIDMNVAENFTVSLMYDYLLMQRQSNGDKVAFVPLTNSDKKIIIETIFGSMNKWCNATGHNLDSEIEIYRAIDDTIGVFYTRLYDNVVKDYGRLRDYYSRNGELTEEAKQILGNNLWIDIDPATNFAEFNAAWGDGAYEKLNLLVRNYNIKHINHPIELVDQVHLMNEKGKLGFNRSLVSTIYRFNEEGYTKRFGAVNPFTEKAPLTNREAFWKRKKAEMVEVLLRNQFDINVTNGENKLSDDEAVLALYIKIEDMSWISTTTGTVYVAKYKPKGADKAINISKLSDFVLIDPETGIETLIKDKNGKTYKDSDFDINNLEGDLEVNPLLATYNALHYFYTQQDALCTVGTHLAHDAKKMRGNVDDNMEEAARYFDQTKRNSGFTATSKQFQLGNINGIVSEYNVAIIEEPKKTVSTIVSSENEVNAIDGATYCDPFTARLENISLTESENKGVNKKPILHSYNERLGCKVMIKTAEFALTNETMRKSEHDRLLMRKMTDITWQTQSGEPLITDITKSFRYKLDGNGEVLYDQYGRPVRQSMDYGDLYYTSRDGSVKEIASFLATGNPNEYEIVTYKVSSPGHRIPDSMRKKRVIIDTNYKLWKAFGGYRSVEWNGNEFVDSERSIEAVVKAMNNIGEPRIADPNKAITMNDVYQNLKHACIHWVCTKGAVKTGIANVNSQKAWVDNNPLNFYKVGMRFAGIQLDAAHTADMSEVSLFTQVLSACCSRGFTGKTAQQVYDSLAALGKYGSKEIFEVYDKYQTTGDRKGFDTAIANLVVNQLAKQPRDTIGSASIQSLIEKSKRGIELKWEDIEGVIPFSDASTFRFLSTTIASGINKASIKPKFFGSLSVLNPSEDRFLQFHGRMLNEFKTAGDVYQLNRQMQQENASKGYLQRQEIQLEHTYEYTDKEGNKLVETIHDPDRLMDFRNRMDRGEISNIMETYITENLLDANYFGGFEIGKHYRVVDKEGNERFWTVEDEMDMNELNDTYIRNNSIREISEFSLKGANLGEYRCTFRGEFTDGGEFTGDLWDLDSVRIRWQLDKFNKAGKATLDNPEFIEYLNSPEFRNSGFISNDELLLINNPGWAIDGVQTPDSKTFIKTLVNRTLQQTQKDVFAITKKEITKGNTVRIGGRELVVDRKFTQTKDFELIAPKMFAQQFGLKTGDSVSEISNDRYFFFKRALQNLKRKVSDQHFDIELKKTNGKHIYLVDDANFNPDGLTQVRVFPKVENGKIYREDSFGNRLYRMASVNDRVYRDVNGNEIIVTKDISKYLDYFNYTAISVSDRILNDTKLSIEDKIDKIKGFIGDNPKSKIAKGFLKFLDNAKNLKELKRGDLDKAIEWAENQISKGKYEKIEKMDPSSLTQHLIKSAFDSGIATHASFLKSLEVVAARIPSQCMHSFMGMKIVGFIDSDINDCYVSKHQILLQGSDY